jgi:hypothetical protein
MYGPSSRSLSRAGAGRHDRDRAGRCLPGPDFPARVTEISPGGVTPKAVETRTERVNLVYAAKVDLDAGWKEPIVPGQPAEVTVIAGSLSLIHARNLVRARRRKRSRGSTWTSHAASFSR